MTKVKLGKTQITVNQNGFGCLPIQRISKEAAAGLLRKARENGIDFFDTARAYTDSEEKLGEAFGGSWDGIFLATKTGSKTPEGFRRDLETSLKNLKRGYIDIYQFHNPEFCPKPGDGSGLYECMLEAKAQGKIRHRPWLHLAGQLQNMDGILSGPLELIPAGHAVSQDPVLRPAGGEGCFLFRHLGISVPDQTAVPAAGGQFPGKGHLFHPAAQGFRESADLGPDLSILPGSAGVMDADPLIRHRLCSQLQQDLPDPTRRQAGQLPEIFQTSGAGAENLRSSHRFPGSPDLLQSLL